MDRNDRQAIEALFDRLATVERQSTPRDGEAEALIRDKIAGQPGAPYYMAQTIVVQEQALAAAEARLAGLEAQVSQTSRANGGSFDSLFGDRRQPARSTGSVPEVQNSDLRQGRQPGGGGFLAGAAQTALGVTGGVLLGNAIAGMLGGHEAKAKDQPRLKRQNPPPMRAPKNRKKNRKRRRLTSRTEGLTLATSTWTSRPRRSLCAVPKPEPCQIGTPVRAENVSL